ncbi:hypothetical protein N44_01279 [Microcystis aeruginosa NIES-44]|uniref:Uncharacterized protein n=1 Tax=Microcystis aeruginosa NIES-44 TaxID=449439 RepID=A0A0A1VTT4_MICAE|nr:hypothetical protein N44_01279 [Microcystis aeruginosa NIES-44]
MWQSYPMDLINTIAQVKKRYKTAKIELAGNNNIFQECGRSC